MKTAGTFASVMLVRDADPAAVDASVRALHNVASSSSQPFEAMTMGQTAARVQFVGTYEKGLASKTISYLCSRDVSVEKLEHRVLASPDDPSTEMLVMEGVLRVPSQVRGAELEEDLGKLGLKLRLLQD